MTPLLCSKSNALLPAASPSSTTAKQMGLPNTGIKCAICCWKYGCDVDVHWEKDKRLLYFHSCSLKEGQQFLPCTQCWWGDAKGHSNTRQPASLLRGYSSCEAWLSFEMQEETVSPFPRSSADNSGDCKC